MNPEEPEIHEVRVEAVTPVQPPPDKKSSNKGLVVVLSIVCFIFLVTIVILVFMIYSNTNPTKTTTLMSSSSATVSQNLSSMSAGNLYTSEELGISFTTNEYFNQPTNIIDSPGFGLGCGDSNCEMYGNRTKKVQIKNTPTENGFSETTIVIYKFSDEDFALINNMKKDFLLFPIAVCDEKSEIVKVNNVDNDLISCVLHDTGPFASEEDCTSGVETLVTASKFYQLFVLLKNNIFITVVSEDLETITSPDCVKTSKYSDPRAVEKAKELIESIKYL